MIDLYEFETWLRGYPSDEVIAKVRDCSNCPVAKFLNHQGHYDVMVSPGYALIDENPIPLPDWTAVLIEHVDLIVNQFEPAIRTRDVTAGQVLDVFTRVKSGELNRIGSDQ